MIPKELKDIIDQYSNGMEPTEEQMDVIMDKMIVLNANPEEVEAYIEKRKASPMATLSVESGGAGEDVSTDWEERLNDAVAEARRLCETRDPAKIQKAADLLEMLISEAAETAHDNQKLETLIDLASYSEYSVMLLYLPAQAKKGFKGMLQLDAKGFDYAKEQLFYAYGYGVGTRKNGKKAYTYASDAMRLAEEEGEPGNVVAACLALAKCHKEGWGVETKSMQKALPYFIRAARVVADNYPSVEEWEQTADDWEKDTFNEIKAALSHLDTSNKKGSREKKPAEQKLSATPSKKKVNKSQTKEDPHPLFHNPGSTTYIDKDKAVYSHNKTILVSIPKEFDGSYSVREGTRRIADHAATLGNLKSLELPSTLEIIGKEAFKNCQQLETVHFKDKLKTIREGAFMGCKRLSQLKLPCNVSEIGKNAFEYCSEIGKETVVVPDSVRRWGKDAISAKELIVPKRMEAIIKRSKGFWSTTKVRTK